MADRAISWSTIIILALGNFLFETNVHSHDAYIPAVLSFFGVPWKDVAYVSSTLHSVHGAMSAVGGVLVLLLIYFTSLKTSFMCMLFLAGCSAVLFAFTQSVFTAGVGMGLIGFFCGAGIMCVRLTCYNMCNKENQFNLTGWLITAPLALAGLLGPSVGSMGVLLPQDYPKVFGENMFLSRFPIVLPNLIIGCAMFLVAILSWYLLQEEEMKSENDTAKESEKKESSSFTSIWNFTKKILRDHDYLLALTIVVIHGTTSSGYGSIVANFLLTPPRMNGYGLDSSQVGILYLVIACLSALSNTFAAPRFNSHLGSRSSFKIMSLLMVLLISLLPNQSSTHKIALLGLHLTLIKVVEGAQFIASTVFLQNSTRRDVAAPALVFAYTLNRAVHALANLSYGKMFSWSLMNNCGMYEEAMGFPFNHYMTFFYLALWHLVDAVIASYVRKDIDERKDVAVT